MTQGYVEERAPATEEKVTDLTQYNGRPKLSPVTEECEEDDDWYFD